MANFLIKTLLPTKYADMTENKEDRNKKHDNDAEMNETAEVITDSEKNNIEDEVAEEELVSEKEEVRSKKSKKEKKFAELEEKFVELTDKHLRLQAEFDNYRKRTIREKAEIIKAGGENVLTGILPVIDDFERAVQALKDISDDDPGKSGTLLIYNKFKDFLKQNNVSEIEALSLEFDVEYHEAVTKVPAPEDKLKGRIIDVIQKGYLLNGKVIRYAKVVVGE